MLSSCHEHVAHTEYRAHGEHTCCNAQYGQQGPGFVMPHVEPDLVPDHAHLKPSLLAIRCFPAHVCQQPDAAPHASPQIDLAIR